MEPFKGKHLLLSGTTDTEYPADVDGAVSTRQVDFVKCLGNQPGLKTFSAGFFPADSQHICGDNASVHIQPAVQIWKQQAPGPAAGIKGWLTETFDLFSVIVDLGTIV
jgi:hypothetical protein